MKNTFTASFYHVAQLLGVCALVWLITLPTCAQPRAYAVAASNITQDEKVYQMAETPPAPEGGLAAFYEYTEDNLVCPKEAKKNGIRGNVLVQFIVEKDGQLSAIKVIKGLGYGCDEAVISCLKTAPRWKPGKQQGKTVRVQKTMSIQIK
jgi:protein TonB